MERAWLEKRSKFYQNHLKDVLLSYWLDRADEQYGGFFTCYNNTGDELVSTDKFVWSQGRLVWMYAKLANSDVVALNDRQQQRCRELSIRGASFLVDHCMLSDESCAFVLDRQGNPKEFWPGSGYDISTFADCFVVMGLSASAELCGDEDMLRKSLKLFHSIAHKMRSGAFRTAPSVRPAGWRVNAVPMIVLNTGQELRAALENAGYIAEAEEVSNICLEAMTDTIEHFVTDEGIVLECLDAWNRPIDTLFGRHLNPGHAIESMWFVIREAKRMGREDIIEKAAHAILVTSRLAWDEQYGGMMYYLDRDGGMPRGRVPEDERAQSDNLIRDWDSKLWWPHTETVYAHLLCYSILNDSDHLEQYERYHRYTFDTFPNPDPDIKEWIQIRDRQGRPGNPNVGDRLPVKDPYHAMRNIYLLIELMRQM